MPARTPKFSPFDRQGGIRPRQEPSPSRPARCPPEPSSATATWAKTSANRPPREPPGPGPPPTRTSPDISSRSTRRAARVKPSCDDRRRRFERLDPLPALRIPLVVRRDAPERHRRGDRQPEPPPHQRRAVPGLALQTPLAAGRHARKTRWPPTSTSPAVPPTSRPCRPTSTRSTRAA